MGEDRRCAPHHSSLKKLLRTLLWSNRSDYHKVGPETAYLGFFIFVIFGFSTPDEVKSEK